MPDTLSFTFYNAGGGSWNVRVPILGLDVSANVNWGNGTSTNIDPYTTHAYSGTGPFTATFTIVSGIVQKLGLGAGQTWTGYQYLTTVSTTNNNTWGLGNYVTSFESAFYGCTLLTSVPTNIPPSVTILASMFGSADNFNSSNVCNWNVSNVTNMAGVFGYCYQFNQNLGSWNVGRVTTMNGMFARAANFNNGGSNTINNWNTSNVTDIQSVFELSAFNQPVGNWDVSKVIYGGRIFFQCSSFNQNLSNWNTGNMVDMGLMFVNCSSFNNGSSTDDRLNPLYWDTRNVTGFNAMFANATKFNQNIGQWNTSNVTYFGQMFLGATLFNQFICGWNVNKGINFDNVFSGASAMTTKYSSYTGYGDTPTAQFFNASLGFIYNLPAAYTLTIPFTYGSNSIDASFNWGDGTTQRITTAPFSHTYTNAGTYEIVCNINSGGNNITKIGSTYQVTGNQYLAAIYSAYAATNWGTGITLSEISFYNNTPTSNLVSVPLSLPANAGVTSLDKMFYGAKLFNQNISTWNVSNIRTMTGMFQGAIIFNKNLSAWSSLYVNLSSMFRDATAFNNGGVSLTWGIQPTNMSSMFYDAPAFNVEISTWNTSNVTTMADMFRATSPSTTAFNKNIRKWQVSNTTTLTNMFNNATPFQTAFYPTSPGYNGIDGSTIDTPLYTFFNEGRYPCFMEGTQILCFKNNKEVYRPIQELRKGDLVKTISNGYLPIHMIGTSELKNPGHDKRVPNRLYKYTSEKYPELFEDLYITGCHSILVPFLTDDEWENTKAMLGDIFVTDNHFRLMACLDENSEPYCKAAYINIYHIALENTNYYMNYGVYANGLLVESCSKRYLTELSNMRILGEEDCRLKDNVLAMNSKYNTNIEVM